MKVISKYFIIGTILVLALVFAGCVTVGRDSLSEKDAVFSYIVTADMLQFAGPKYQSSEYFLGVCEAILEIGKGSFMVSPGDLAPPQHVFDTVRKVLGEDYPWYPVVGNHDVETAEDIAWLRNWGRKDIPNLVRKGPENSEETTYSFDFENAHFVIINEYYDGKSDAASTKGDIVEPLYNWLKNDLEANSKPFVFVFGHEPIVSIPDYHNGRHRHKGDNLDFYPDNWPVHGHQAAWRAIRADERLQVLWRPTYAPWLNPAEKIWKLIRQKLTHMHPYADDKKSLSMNIERLLNLSAGDPQVLLKYTGTGKSKLYCS